MVAPSVAVTISLSSGYKWNLWLSNGSVDILVSNTDKYTQKCVVTCVQSVAISIFPYWPWKILQEREWWIYEDNVLSSSFPLALSHLLELWIHIMGEDEQTLWHLSKLQPKPLPSRTKIGKWEYVLYFCAKSGRVAQKVNYAGQIWNS